LKTTPLLKNRPRFHHAQRDIPDGLLKAAPDGIHARRGDIGS
jgi:hypothetical protein